MRLKMSIPTISSPLANLLFDISNVVLSIGAAAVLIGTLGVIWMGSVKERYSDERIAANEAKTAGANAAAEQAKEGAAQADERAGNANREAARANERAATLEVEAATARERAARLETDAELMRTQLQEVGRSADYAKKRIAYRIVDRQKLLSELRNKPKGRVRLQYVSGDQEAYTFAMQLKLYLEEAKWTVSSPPSSIDPATVAPAPMMPMVFSVKPDGSSTMIGEPGSSITIMSNSRAGRDAKNLSDAISSAGVITNIFLSSDIISSDVLVRIGPRLN